MIEKILVLGSKHNSELPDIPVSKIYAANAAALRAVQYRKKYNDNKLICCTNGKEYDRNPIVQNAIDQAKPSKIIFRSQKSNFKKKNDCETIYMNNKEQIKFQSNFYEKKKISFYLGETKYKKKNIYETIRYFYNSYKNDKFLGASTGLFSIFLALNENVNSDIIISGISTAGGPQFYKSARFVDQDHAPRAAVDNYLFAKINDKYKKKIMTLDIEMSNYYGLRYFDKERINDYE